MSMLLILEFFLSIATVDFWFKLLKFRPAKSATFQETHLERAEYIFLCKMFTNVRVNIILVQSVSVKCTG